METLHDDQIIVELLDLIILNEFLRKDLLKKMKEYILNFEKSTPFDFSRPVSYIDFADFINRTEKEASLEMKLKQFLFNLELFAIKFFRISEVSKESLKGTKLKKLRQAFAHRKSSDILSGKERLVIFGGFLYNFETLDVSNLGEGGKSAEHISYDYALYIEAIIDNFSHFGARINNVKQLRKLNESLIVKLFGSDNPARAT